MFYCCLGFSRWTNKQSPCKNVHRISSHIWISLLAHGKNADIHTRQDGAATGISYVFTFQGTDFVDDRRLALINAIYDTLYKIKS